MKRVSLTFHTIRYLKYKQVLARVYYYLRKPRIPKFNSVTTRKMIAPWGAPAYMRPATSDGETYSFLGHTSMHGDACNSRSHSKLWLYNLHYQNDLNSVGASERAPLLNSMIERWIQNNPPIEGIGWEPYCISLRTVNWIKWFCGKPSSDVPRDWVNSLAIQIGVLEQKIEYHILGNHLFANAKAMVFAGAYFGGEQGDRWLQKGLALLDSQLEEQFLSDGGHFELSPMYHSTLLWDIADLINIARLSPLTDLAERTDLLRVKLAKGISWLQSMVHPDGDISFFNDSTLGVAPALVDILNYAKFLCIEFTEPKLDNWSGVMLQDTGYCSVSFDDGSRLIADVGCVGPDYQPGHAHADTLSCELSLCGQRVFVNSGISQYGEGAERNRQRSTSAHNTVEVDGVNSSEVWAGFRVARRAYPTGVEYTETRDVFRIVAAHTGYSRLRGKVIHHRIWEASRGNIRVVDELDGQYHRATGFWFLHPSIGVSMRDNLTVDLTISSCLSASVSITGANIKLEDATWHPGFGESMPTSRIVFNFDSPIVTTDVCWCRD